MSLRSDLLGAVTFMLTGIDDLAINLSWAEETVDSLIQLQAMDLAETNNEDAQAFIKHMNTARQHLEAFIASLKEAHDAGRKYERYLL
jgi:hypothetical protein